ncbi:hypothetical protein G9P44_002222 [Scheffersomyces stipitis]|nr:hypothetical protein G9P44_002222 [Scheffersomyces stipitis]
MSSGKAASRVGSKIRLVSVVKNGVVAGVSKLSCSPYVSRAIIIVLMSNVLFMVLSRFDVTWLAKRDSSLTVEHMAEFETTSPMLGESLDNSYFRLEKCEAEVLDLNDTVSSSKPSISNELAKGFDPRLMPALWTSSIRSHLENGFWDTSLAIPFSWASWVDLKKNFVNPGLLFDDHELNCNNFAHLFRLEYDNFTSSCVNYANSPSSYPKMKINSTIDFPMPVEARRIVGSLYVLHYAPIPKRIAFLGLNHSALIVPTEEINAHALGRMDRSDLVRNYMLQSDQNTTKHIGSINLKNELIRLNETINNYTNSISFIRDTDLNTDIFRRVSNFRDQNNPERHDFIFDFDVFYNDTKQRIVNSSQSNSINDLDTTLMSSMNYEMLNYPNFTKYFHEASIIGSKKGAHYDWRFFQKLDYSDYEKKAIFHRLSRAWLRFANSLNISTWLAHGTLLGWYWNGINMPWDEDLDVQITMESMIKLARNYNNTLVVDLSDIDNDPSLGIGKYLVDINPNFFSRDKGDGQNTIDARFIDTSSGFYVDITALALTDSAAEVTLSSKKSREFNQVLDPEFCEKEKSETIVRNNLIEQLSSIRSTLIEKKSIYNCRNNHFYTLDDLIPFKRTLFEGAIANVPKNYEKILKREYAKGLYNRQYEGHTFRPVLDLWVPSNICKKDEIGNRCFDRVVSLDAKYSRPMTSFHRSEMFQINQKVNKVGEELKPCRVEPWIIRRAQHIQKMMEMKYELS